MSEAEVWFKKGVEAYGAGRYAEALEAFDEAIRLDPAAAIAWNNKGSTLNGLGRHAAALEALNEAIRLDPADAIAWRNRSLALRKLDRLPEAHRSLLRVAYIAERGLTWKQCFDAFKLLPKVVDRLRTTGAAPLLVLSLFHSHGLLAAFLRHPAFLSEAEARARPYLKLSEYSRTGKGTLSPRGWLVTLGLGAYYLGDPFEAQRHFARLDDLDEGDLLGQFYYALTYRAYEMENPGLLEDARAHARELLQAAGRGQEVDPEQLYYAGHLFAFDYGAAPQPLLALRCFERAAPAFDPASADADEAARAGFLPARYMRALVLDAAGRHAERDAAIEQLLWHERLLFEAGDEGFLRGVALGHVEVSEPGWERPFRKYAHAAEVQDALAFVYEWLAERERADESLPEKWAFVDAVRPHEHERAWEAWVLADGTVAAIEQAVEAAKGEQLALMRARLRHHEAGDFLEQESASSEDLERAVARRLYVLNEGADAKPYVTLVRHLAFSGRLDGRAALMLLLYVRARFPEANPFEKLQEESLKGALTYLAGEPVDALIMLFGVGGSLASGVATAGTSAVLVQLCVEYARTLRTEERRAEAYGPFKRDFYAHLEAMRERLGQGLDTYLEELADLASPDDEEDRDEQEGDSF